MKFEKGKLEKPNIWLSTYKIIKSRKSGLFYISELSCSDVDGIYLNNRPKRAENTPG